MGSDPRVYAVLAFTPGLHSLLDPLEPVVPALLGKELRDCNLALSRLAQIRVAIGAPLRIAAELDGDIDTARLRCLFGNGFDAIVELGIAIRDRRGGVAIEFRPQVAHPGTAVELATRCATQHCAVARLGPAARPLWYELSLGPPLRMRISGAPLGGGARRVVAALDGLRATVPALVSIRARDVAGALELETSGATDEALAEALKEHLIEAFRVPSVSMIPTLRIGDHIFTVKGPLMPSLEPGDIIVYRTTEGTYVKRYAAGPGQTVTETPAGITIDGKLVPSEPVRAGVSYVDVVPEDGSTRTVVGDIAREYLGTRSHLVMRAGPRRTGSWTVPAGQLFVLGDNRENSNDSRFHGAIPRDALVGKAIGIWLATRDDGMPDWDRIGTAIE